MEAMLFREFSTVLDPYLDPAQQRYFMYESIQNRYRLLKLPFMEPYRQKDVIFYQSEACRLAISFSGIIQYYLDPSSIIYKSLAAQLTSALKSSDLSSLWCPATDLLAWVLNLGAHMTEGQKTELFFHVHLAKCGLRLGWKDWADCRSLIKNFFYTDRLHERSFRAIWGKVKKIMDLG